MGASTHIGEAVDLGPPRVVHCLHQPHHLYIGRPSKWGNPFKIGRDGTRQQVIEQYERFILQSPQLLADIHELEGLVLGCWCAPRPCHGDVLLKLANRGDQLAVTTGLIRLPPGRGSLYDPAVFAQARAASGAEFGDPRRDATNMGHAS